jgi:uncharacterized iron-regulated protein
MIDAQVKRSEIREIQKHRLDASEQVHREVDVRNLLRLDKLV